MEEDLLLKSVEGTATAERIRKLRGIYSQLNAAQERFCGDLGIRCIPGCGCCCEHFIPDMGESEAEYLALGLIAQGRESELSSACAAEGDGCPFYIKEADGHCSIYAYRPLLCRLFGAAASTDKEGRFVFGGCRWDRDMKKYGSDELAKTDAVVMSDYGLMLEECDAGVTQRYPIAQAARRAVEKLELLLSLADEDEK